MTTKTPSAEAVARSVAFYDKHREAWGLEDLSVAFDAALAPWREALDNFVANIEEEDRLHTLTREQLIFKLRVVRSRSRALLSEGGE